MPSRLDCGTMQPAAESANGDAKAPTNATWVNKQYLDPILLVHQALVRSDGVDGLRDCSPTDDDAEASTNAEATADARLLVKLDDNRTVNLYETVGLLAFRSDSRISG